MTHWVDYTNPDETGVYIELVKEIYKNEKISFNYSTYNRMTSLFDKDGNDFVIGVAKEDVPKAFYPQWYLDYDYPVYAYVLKSNNNINNVSDLNGRLLSWFRGYDMDNYIDFSHDNYPIDTLEMAMNLLSNGRVDAFVDFEYNIPDDIKAAVKRFPILPSRPIYLAFSNSDKGRQLAHTFDVEMARLHSNGKLKQIYNTGYIHTKFDSFDPDKPKIVISTRDASTLKIEMESSIYSLEASLYKQIIERLPQYNILFVKAANTNDEEQYALDNCFANKVRTVHRDKDFLISSPFSIYMLPRLYSKHDISNVKFDNLNTLLSKKNLKLGLPSDRRLHETVELLLNSVENRFIVDTATQPLTRLKELNSMDNFTISVEYPNDVVTYWPQISDEPLYSLPLPIKELYTLGHLMCKRSEKNQTFIQDFNRVLADISKSNAYFSLMSNAASGVSKEEFKRYYNQIFAHYQ